MFQRRSKKEHPPHQQHTMSYFVQQNDGSQTDRPRGKLQHGTSSRPLSASRVKRGKTREEMIDTELKHMGSRDPLGENFLTKKLEKSEAPARGKGHGNEISARYKTSHIFEGAQPNKQPKLRVRLGVQEEDLAKIYKHDTRKDEAATKMTSDLSLVDKMYACQYPMPHAQEQYIPEKKRFDANFQKFPESEIPGFSGMGVFCKPQRPRALATKAPDVFIPDIPTRKPIAPRHRNASIFNPLNGEKSAWYGNHPHPHAAQE